MNDGRRFAPVLECRVRTVDGELRLFAPRPGLYRDAPPSGTLVRPGDAVGALEVLGVIHPLRAPRGAFGVVTPLLEGRRRARHPVDAALALMQLDPNAVAGGAEIASDEAHDEHGGPVFETPLGGRYYARPAPDADPFVRPGDSLKGGETVALIEVMKTFNRVKYSGEPATVRRVVPADGDDVVAGEVLLALEP
ncbi:MAG: biotin/lipoyl-containing protein [Sandaracinaceae bacterium]